MNKIEDVLQTGFDIEGQEVMLIAVMETIYDLISKEVIGQPDTEVRGSTQSPLNPNYWTKKTAHRNELRDQQLLALNKLFGRKS
jgi:hypothetical protein